MVIGGITILYKQIYYSIRFIKMLTYLYTLIANKLIRYCRQKKKVHVFSVYEQGGARSCAIDNSK